MSFPRPRILYAEDDPDTRELLFVLLSTEGFDVVCAETSAAALQLAQTETFDLLMFDSWLPERSGVQLTTEVRQFDAHTPILFYSGAASEQDRQAARRAGAQGYLVKPVDLDDLIAEVKRVIAEATVARKRKTVNA